jgi:hypothetical protein
LHIVAKEFHQATDQSNEPVKNATERNASAQQTELIMPMNRKREAGAPTGKAPTARLQRAAPKEWQEVRPAKVAQGKKLAQDPNYPSRAVVESVADLLARHWKRGN